MAEEVTYSLNDLFAMNPAAIADNVYKMIIPVDTQN